MPGAHIRFFMTGVRAKIRDGSERRLFERRSDNCRDRLGRTIQVDSKQFGNQLFSSRACPTKIRNGKRPLATL